MLTLPDDFQPGLLPADDSDTPIQWFVFAGGNLLVRPTSDGVALPVAAVWPFAKLVTVRRLYLGSWRGQPCHAAEVETATPPPPGMNFESLRALWSRLDEGLLGVAGHAEQLIEWDRSHQFCGCCGAQTQRRADAIWDWYLDSMKREAMVPGGFGETIFRAADAGEIEPEVAPLLVRSFLRGGLDTTSSMISAALWYLARDPEQWTLLKQDPARIRQALDEAMRLETPIQNVCRQTMREVEIDGVTVENDAKILVLSLIHI